MCGSIGNIDLVSLNDVEWNDYRPSNSFLSAPGSFFFKNWIVFPVSRKMEKQINCKKNTNFEI